MGRRRRVEWALQLFSGAIVAALIAMAMVAVREIAVSHRVATRAAQADLAALKEAANLQSLLYQRGFVEQYFLTRDAHWLDELQKATPDFEAWLQRATVDAQTPEAGAAAAALVTEYGRYDAEREHAIQFFQNGDEAAAVRTLTSNVGRAERLRSLANKLISIRRAELAARLREADRAWRQSLLVLALAVVLAILAAAGIGYFFARRVTRPLYELVLRAETAGSGARVEVSGSDEIGALSEHVTRLAREIESSSTQLAEHRQRLAQAEKMSALGEMATGVAHELLNPLTGVKTALQLLARSAPSAEELRATVAEVDAEIRRLDGMARRLIAFARPLRPMVRTCALSEVLATVTQATRGEAEPRRVQIETALDEAPTIQADPDLMVQVLINLTINACQAMPAGGRVLVSSRRAGGWSIIEVRDQGSGLAPGAAARLFTPFFTTKTEGHGLGLAVSQNIVLSHGGRIEARANEPERGTTFAVWLPDGPAVELAA